VAVQSPTAPFVGAVDASHDAAATLRAPAGTVIPAIPVAVTTTLAAFVENAAALLSVVITAVALDAGTLITASTLTLADAGDDVPAFLAPMAKFATLAVARSVFASARVVDETSYVTDAARSRRRADVAWTLVIALSATPNAVAAAALKALVIGVEANDMEPETT
jgi:hypothetical protein